MSYDGSESATDRAQPHLGGNIRGDDLHTWCPRVWGYVLDRLGIESVLDFGSGFGTQALVAQEDGAGHVTRSAMIFKNHKLL